MKDPTSMLEARIVREIHRALKLHGANPALQAEARKRTRADQQFVSRAYETLERLGASKWLLVTLESWRASASDEMTYESLKAINEGRFAVNITATTET
jgi:hypothetical protein